jgi:phosphate acetyltransferase
MPEGDEPRVLRAADALLRLKAVDLVLLGNPSNIRALAGQLGVDIAGVDIVNPSDNPWFESYASMYNDLRAHKGMTLEHAREAIVDPPLFGTLMVSTGRADGMVAGARTSTAATIRPAFQVIKTKPGCSLVSSVFFMCLEDRVLVYGDCAVNPDPTAQQLAEIAVTSAETARAFGIEPIVAMLSYSTGTSGQGADVDKVREAVAIAKEIAPDLLLEGPLQYDAAVDASVAKTKLPDSKVGGRATVFVFPDLNTGNNTYKAVQRSARAVAIGPVLQGLNKPVNDLSRGCLVEDIINTVAITAVQAQGGS